jgi:hypothetical protein
MSVRGEVSWSSIDDGVVGGRGWTYSASWLAAQVLSCGQADHNCKGEDGELHFCRAVGERLTYVEWSSCEVDDARNR